MATELPWEEHNIVVSGTTVYYSTTGHSSLPQVVLLHGFRSNHHGLDSIAAYLTGYRLIAPDIPGFGQTEPGAGRLTLEGQAAVLNEFLAQTVTGPYTLIGHSLGATIALLMSQQLVPERVGAVLMNPMAETTQSVSGLARSYLQIAAQLPDWAKRRWFGNKTMIWLGDHWIFRTGTRHSQRAILTRDYNSLSELRPDVYIAIFQSYDTTDFDAAARRVTGAIYCIGGDSDPFVPKTKLLHLAQLIPDAEVQVLAGRGHLFPVEEPAYAAELILEWLGKTH